jgi:hypothetical protein
VLRIIYLGKTVQSELTNQSFPNFLGAKHDENKRTKKVIRIHREKTTHLITFFFFYFLKSDQFPGIQTLPIRTPSGVL